MLVWEGPICTVLTLKLKLSYYTNDSIWEFISLHLYVNCMFSQVDLRGPGIGLHSAWGDAMPPSCLRLWLGCQIYYIFAFCFFSVDNLSVLSSSSLLYWLQRMTSLMIAGVMLVVMAMMGLPSVRAVQCFVCDSIANPWCAEPFSFPSKPSSSIRFCTGLACYKIWAVGGG